MSFDPSRYTASWRWFVIAVLLPVAWLALLRTASLSAGVELEQDSYYHAMMADLFPDVCVEKTFPYTTMSVWHTKFYDKELGFHAVLAGMRRISQALGLPLGPPFHLPVLAFAIGTIVVFAAIVRSYRVPHPEIFSLLLVAISPFFTFRLMMLRPQHLSIAFMLLFCWQATRLRSTRDLWKPAALAFAAAYSYSHPHFLLLPAVAWGAFCWKKDRRLAWLLPGATLAGLLAGFALHPQFPNTFLLWKIQNIDVIRQALLGYAAVYTGGELDRPDAAWLLAEFGVWLIVLINVRLWVVLRKPGRKAPLASETLFMLAMSIFWTVATLLSKRCMEYAAPLSLLALALLYRDLMLSRLAGASRIRRPALATVVAATCLLAVLTGVRDVRLIRSNPYPEFSQFSEWAGRTLPDGTRIANLLWADFPMLFYSAPQFGYLMGLDPMFGYHADPRRVETLERFRTGQLFLGPAELRELTGARFAFVSRRAAPLAKILIDQGYVVVYKGSDGWLFDQQHELEMTQPSR